MSSDRAARTVLVTGASSGIGRELARCAARDGHRVLLVARREGELHALARSLHEELGAKVEPWPCDLLADGAVAELLAGLAQARRRIDILINNAGVLQQGPFVRQGWPAQRSMIGLNLQVPTELIAGVLPAMKRRGFGRILNVASIASFQPVPTLATYAATKAYLLSLTESLAEELSGSGVTVTALCPGITATGMLDGAAARNPQLAALPGFVVGDAAEVALAGWKACLAGEVLVVPGLVNQAVTLAASGTPRALLRRVVGAVSRRLQHERGGR